MCTYPAKLTTNQINWPLLGDYPWSCGVSLVFFWIRTISCVSQILYRTGIILTYRNGLKLLWDQCRFEIFQPPFGPCGYNLGSMDGKLPQRTKNPNPSVSPTISLSPNPMGNRQFILLGRQETMPGQVSHLDSQESWPKVASASPVKRKFTKGVSPSVRRHIAGVNLSPPAYLEDHDHKSPSYWDPFQMALL